MKWSCCETGTDILPIMFGEEGETVLSAGAVGSVDGGGPISVWQEYELRPNPHVEAAKTRSPGMQLAEFIHAHKPYVTTRIKDKTFQLLDGQEVCIDPYYVFLARSNNNVRLLEGGSLFPALHAAGSLEAIEKDLIIDAARQLETPK